MHFVYHIKRNKPINAKSTAGLRCIYGSWLQTDRQTDRLSGPTAPTLSHAMFIRYAYYALLASIITVCKKLSCLVKNAKVLFS